MYSIVSNYNCLLYSYLTRNKNEENKKPQLEISNWGFFIFI